MAAATASPTWTPTDEQAPSPVQRDRGPVQRDRGPRFVVCDDDLDLPECLRVVPKPQAVAGDSGWEHDLAHDLNNCITALRLTFDLITETEVSAEQLVELIDDGQEVLDRTAALARTLHAKGA